MPLASLCGSNSPRMHAYWHSLQSCLLCIPVSGLDRLSWHAAAVYIVMCVCKKNEHIRTALRRWHTAAAFCQADCKGWLLQCTCVHAYMHMYM